MQKIGSLGGEFYVFVRIGQYGWYGLKHHCSKKRDLFFEFRKVNLVFVQKTALSKVNFMFRQNWPPLSLGVKTPSDKEKIIFSDLRD